MRIYTYLSLPGLIIHEFMHILFGALSGYFFSFKDSYTLWREDGALSVGLNPKSKKMNAFQMLMVPMAPLYLIIAIAVLAFFNPIFLGILIYFIVTWMYSFPSVGDFDQIRYAKVFLKYSFYDETFVRFMNIKNASALKEVKGELELTIEDPNF